MRKWSHEYSIEVDLPLETVWGFYINPGNWPKWLDQIDSCVCEEDLKTGSIVMTKIKNRSLCLPIWITDVVPSQECKILIKAPFFVQQSSFAVSWISPMKTCLTLKTSVESILTPFFKSFYRKRVETQNSKSLEFLLRS
jgi:hypothetical protein